MLQEANSKPHIPEMFSIPALSRIQLSGSLGKLTKDSLEGPGERNVDPEEDTWTSPERIEIRVEIFVEIFNAFHHLNFQFVAPGSGNSINSTIRGLRVLSRAHCSRHVQFAPDCTTRDVRSRSPVSGAEL